MKKLIVILLSLFLLTGCKMVDSRAKMSVEDYLNNYKRLDENVKSQLDALIENENLTSKQKEIYREILERQYKDMEYKIIDEKIDDNDATISVELTVYDYYKIQEEISDYLKNNREEFYKDGTYDEDMYIDYKLDKMKKYDEKVTYTIDFKLSKKDGKWIIDDLNENDIEKIHGIYDYSND